MSTTKEIVNRVETKLSQHIIDVSKCLEGCKCERCFQRYLDSVVNFSNRVTPVEALPIEVERWVEN